MGGAPAHKAHSKSLLRRALRSAIGPRPATGPHSAPGGLLRRGDGTRRQPIAKTKLAASNIKNRSKWLGRKTANGSKRLWKSRPARWGRAGVKRSWGVAWPAVCSASKGAWTAIRHRNWSTVKAAMAASWAKSRAKWGPTKGKHAVAAAANATPAPIVPATTVNMPPNGAPTVPARQQVPGGPTVAVPKYVTTTAEMLGAAMMYNPEGMMEVGNDLAQLPVALQNVANALKIMTQRANDQDPIHPTIVDMMSQIYGKLQEAATMAEDLGPAFKKLHQVDIQRIQAPRVNEQKWDFSVNKGQALS